MDEISRLLLQETRDIVVAQVPVLDEVKTLVHSLDARVKILEGSHLVTKDRSERSEKGDIRGLKVTALLLAAMNLLLAAKTFAAK